MWSSTASASRPCSTANPSRARLPPAPHRLRFDNTLHKKTVEFTASADERVEYRLANSAGRFALPFLAVMGVAPLYLKIERA